GKRRIQAVEKKGVFVACLAYGCFDLIQMPLDCGSDLLVTSGPQNPVVQRHGSEAVDIAEHQEGQGPLYRREIFLGFNDSEERVGPCRQPSQVIARCGHDEVEVSISFPRVSSGHNCLQSSCGLLESDTGLRSVTT